MCICICFHFIFLLILSLPLAYLRLLSVSVVCHFEGESISHVDLWTPDFMFYFCLHYCFALVSFLSQVGYRCLGAYLLSQDKQSMLFCIALRKHTPLLLLMCEACWVPIANLSIHLSLAIAR